jgi:hypothetical protein
MHFWCDTWPELVVLLALLAMVGALVLTVFLPR